MAKDFSRYSEKLVRAGLIGEGGLLMGVRNDRNVQWLGQSRLCGMLSKVLLEMNLGAAMLTRPAKPYAILLDYLADTAPDGTIHPQDFETHLLLRDLPVVSAWTEETLMKALECRRAAILPGLGVLAVGETGAEQAFVVTSAVYFACFVKFFSDRLFPRPGERDDARIVDVLDGVSGRAMPDSSASLAAGPFVAEEDILRGIAEAGLRTVGAGLVDANFGNVSYRLEDRLYITRKKSALDELEGQIITVPLLGCPDDLAARASTELPSHREIVLSSHYRAILHGHPRFSVILSMDCAYRPDCPDRTECSIRCGRERFVLDIPVVSGEAGAGACGIHRTVPPAMGRGRGVIVYGHGVFTGGRNDFNEAFLTLLDIEKKCRDAYFRRIAEAF